MSLQALARSLGLSISTVSRALNGYSDVSATTRERVQRAAEAMNYRPHPVAHRLATGRIGAVALVSSIRAGRNFDASFEPLLEGLSEGLAGSDTFAFSTSIATGEHELRDLARLLDARVVDGVIVTRTRSDDARVALLQARGIPFVTHGRTLANAPHAWVDTDNEAAMALPTQRLAELGHRRFALLNGPAEMNYAHLRELGFTRALREAGLDPAEAPVTHCEISAVQAQAQAELLLDRAQPPTALVCASDVMALGALLACRARGLRIGRDVSVTGYGNTEPGLYADPALATIDHSSVANGRHLAALLLRVLDGEPPAGLHTLEPVRFIERASIGPAPR